MTISETIIFYLCAYVMCLMLPNFLLAIPFAWMMKRYVWYIWFYYVRVTCQVLSDFIMYVVYKENR